MEIEYKLGLEEYLEHQLYIISLSENFKKRFARIRLIGPAILVIMAVYFYFSIPAKEEFIKLFISGICLTMAILSFYLFPARTKTSIRKKIIVQLRELYKEKMDKATFLSLEELSILSKNNEGESRVSIKEIKNIVELDKIICITMNSGNNIIISKEHINDLNLLKKYLQEISSKHDISYSVQDKWKWQ